MAKIEGIEITNYRVLRDIILGTWWKTPRAAPLTPMTAVIGRNGVGKSALFDAFDFLANCLKLGVEDACGARGGFDRIRSQGSERPIAFTIRYRQDRQTQPMTYRLAIDKDDAGRPYVWLESLSQQRKGRTRHLPLCFLMLNEGEGVAWKGDAQGSQSTRARSPDPT